jgi:valyl-tRNA synthetase
MSSREPLAKTFVPREVEEGIYALWERSGAFAADPASGKPPFTIMIPPPNVTGSLHMGHALTFTLQDVLIRWRRMQGRDALWQPGTDHAGIATQMVVERLLAAEGLTRQELGREAFLERVWQWKERSGGEITRQLRRLGASLDWRRERFTLDPGLSAAVRRVFVTLAREGLVYRARRLVNWDPKLQTAISDLEVENREVKGHLWYIRYPLAGRPGQFIEVATTRPETMLGDVAVAVHPEDPRYQALIGEEAILPLVGRRLPILADPFVDREKGSGAVKITPAHDFNDFALAERQDALRGTPLPRPSVIDRAGRITLAELADVTRDPAAAAFYDADFLAGLEGMERFAARERIVARLDALGLLARVEDHLHTVPHGDRSGVPIEPLLTWQWFVDAKVLAAPAEAAVREGRIRFVPKMWENTFFAWMRDIQPWCVSRQLWWGHRIPAWYGPDGQVFVAESEAEAAALARAAYGAEVPLRQDEDVLDTWFSSALWPFSTLGWPDSTLELRRYYPTDVLVTGFDIIFFWVARMMMMGLHFMKDVPFRDVYIHGLVRDERGQKMSKTKGNVIDPLAIIDEFGADALRFTICAAAGPGRDIKLGRARIESHRPFITKLWNAARFCEMNGIEGKTAPPASPAHPLTLWILAAADRAITEANAALEAYRFDEYALTCHHFLWDVFCDWFLEFLKSSLATAGDGGAELRQAAGYTLGVVLRLLHPVIPFVTEKLWGHFGFGAEGTLVRAPWPEPAAPPAAASAHAGVETVIRLISEIRSVRAALNVPPAARPRLVLREEGERGKALAPLIDAFAEPIARLAGLGAIVQASPGEALPGVRLALEGLAGGLDVAGLIDVAAETARLAEESRKRAREIAKLEEKLARPDFRSRAPAEVVAETEARCAALRREQAAIETSLAQLALLQG